MELQKPQYIKIDEFGDKYYYEDISMSTLHREDGPAIEWGCVRYRPSGGLWYKNGKLHRDAGPAVVSLSGYKVWYQNGLMHREDGPAIEYIDGGKSWYYKGKKHRVGGPAVERTDGGLPEWWVNGEQISTPVVVGTETFLQLEKIVELSLRSASLILDQLLTPENGSVLTAVRNDLIETSTIAENILSKLLAEVQI